MRFGAYELLVNRIDFKVKKVNIDGKTIKLQIWDTAGQERFRTITSAYYRGAMGILLVYDITDTASFNNVRNWVRNIEQHAGDNVNKVLVGNKLDLEAKRAVSRAEGQALADEFGFRFVETSAKDNTNVEEVFTTIARDVLVRLQQEELQQQQQQAGPGGMGGVGGVGAQQVLLDSAAAAQHGGSKKSSCCG